MIQGKTARPVCNKDYLESRPEARKVAVKHKKLQIKIYILIYLNSVSKNQESSVEIMGRKVSEMPERKGTVKQQELGLNV